MIRVADYIIDRLSHSSIKCIFMVTGRGVLYLSDAVARSDIMKGVSVHHEQSAAYAAMASAESTNGMGACLVSTGCAATNAITGLLSAWQDNIPVIFISGQNILHETTTYTKIPLRTFGQQETDIVTIVKSITKYAVMIDDPSKIGYELDKAFYLAEVGRKGPVWIDVPLDIQNARINQDALEHFSPPSTCSPTPSQDDINYVIKAFKEAKRPVILVGSGIRSANAIDLLSIFLEKYPIPLTYSPSATDIYGARNMLAIGAVSSMGGTRAGNFTVQNSDLLLVLGNRLSPMVTSSEYAKFARKAKIIVVDIDKVEHSKNTVKIDRLIIADVRDFILKLLEFGITPASEQWINKCTHWKNIFPKCEDRHRLSEKVDLYYFTEILSKKLPDDAIILTDAGLEEVIIPTNIVLRDGQRCIHPSSQGAMGFVLPGIIGAHFSQNKKNIIAVVGDGSIMMNIQELQTISYHNIPAKIFVINNNGYSIIRRRQHTLFRSRTIGNDPDDGVGYPEFKKVAECFNLKYVLIENSHNLESRVSDVLNDTGCILCEVMGLEDQEYIHSSYTRSIKGGVVNRPLEDQSPYLDRDIFLSEMVIEPIDQ